MNFKSQLILLLISGVGYLGIFLLKHYKNILLPSEEKMKIIINKIGCCLRVSIIPFSILVGGTYCYYSNKIYLVFLLLIFATSYLLIILNTER